MAKSWSRATHEDCGSQRWAAVQLSIADAVIRQTQPRLPCIAGWPHTPLPGPPQDRHTPHVFALDRHTHRPTPARRCAHPQTPPHPLTPSRTPARLNRTQLRAHAQSNPAASRAAKVNQADCPAAAGRTLCGALAALATHPNPFRTLTIHSTKAARHIDPATLPQNRTPR